MTYRSTETYSCQTCGNSFKSTASLASHKYRYHPYSSKASTRPTSNEFDRQSSISSLDHEFGYLSANNQLDKHKLDIDNLQSTVRELRSLMNKVDTKVLLQGVALDGVERFVRNQRTRPDTGNARIVNYYNPDEVSLIKDQTNDNTNRIRVIEENIDNKHNQQIEQVGNEDEVAKQDMIDDMIEVREMFINNNYEGLKTDIPKLRHSIRIMLDSLELQKLDDEDVQLLEDLCTSSKREVLALLQANFGHLVNIFKRLKPEFEGLFEEDENSELEGWDGNKTAGDDSGDDLAKKREDVTSESESDENQTEDETEEDKSGEESEVSGDETDQEDQSKHLENNSQGEASVRVRAPKFPSALAKLFF